MVAHQSDRIRLAKDGIFPVTKDKDGLLLKKLPASGFHFPGTIQGEGKLSGIPSLFIRLAGCNLHCMWKNPDGSYTPCDTAYASYQTEEAFYETVETISRVVHNNTEFIDHLVITGGEPFLQATPLISLCRKLKEYKAYHISIETNATIYDENLARETDFFSLSPKLSGSTPPMPYQTMHDNGRIRKEVIQNFINHALEHRKDFQLKFVPASARDIEEIHALLADIKGWKKEDILLMPVGKNAGELRKNSSSILQWCIRNGWRYCDRLHLSLWGDCPGV